MQCPIHNSLLNQESFGSEHLHQCDACKGTFVEAHIFSEIRAFYAIENHKRATRNSEIIKRSDNAVLICPKDGKPMDTVMYKGVEIDVCSNCHGVWFDEDELEKINAQVAMAKPVNLANIVEEKPLTYRRAGVIDGLDGIDIAGGIIWFIASIYD
jgi:hypothetical protein